MTRSASLRVVRLDPHHPICQYPNGDHLDGRDPERCAYCAALLRRDYAQSGLNLGLSSARIHEDPLDFRYRP